MFEEYKEYRRLVDDTELYINGRFVSAVENTVTTFRIFKEKCEKNTCELIEAIKRLDTALVVALIDVRPSDVTFLQAIRHAADWKKENTEQMIAEWRSYARRSLVPGIAGAMAKAISSLFDRGETASAEEDDF